MQLIHKNKITPTLATKYGEYLGEVKLLRDQIPHYAVDDSHPLFSQLLMDLIAANPTVAQRKRGDGGVGTELKKLLGKLGIYPEKGCKCERRAKIMDFQGIEWCEKNIEGIVNWLEGEAKSRGLPFLRIVGKKVVQIAINRAKKQRTLTTIQEPIKVIPVRGKHSIGESDGKETGVNH